MRPFVCRALAGTTSLTSNTGSKSTMQAHMNIRPFGRIKHICRCGRPSLYRSPSGRYAADRDHDLCPRCFMSERERVRALDLNVRRGSRVSK